MYYIYMIRCKDNSIYTGITVDLERRINEHYSKDTKCAKYTFSHDVQKVECAWKTETRVLASKLEYHIKKLLKPQKEELILKNNIQKLLGTKVDSVQYERIYNVLDFI